MTLPRVIDIVPRTREGMHFGAKLALGAGIATACAVGFTFRRRPHLQQFTAMVTATALVVRTGPWLVQYGAGVWDGARAAILHSGYEPTEQAVNAAAARHLLTAALGPFTPKNWLPTIELDPISREDATP